MYVPWNGTDDACHLPYKMVCSPVSEETIDDCGGLKLEYSNRETFEYVCTWESICWSQSCFQLGLMSGDTVTYLKERERVE
jgi:hypothetical protein